MTLSNELFILKAKVKIRLWLKHYFLLLPIFLVLMVCMISPFPTKGAETAQNGTAKVEIPSMGSAYTVPNMCGLSTVDCEDETVEGRIRIAALAYGVDQDTAIRIAKCESSLNPLARHPISTAKGLFMFTDPTWKFIGAKGSQFDEAENIKQFMINFPKHKSWWICK